MEKPESSYAQIRLFAKKREVEKFHQTIYVKNELEEYIFLLDYVLYWILYKNKLLPINPFVMPYKK